MPLFQAAQRLAPMSMTSIHAHYFEAIVYFREEKWQRAEEAFRRLIRTFPEALNVPEALYHVGICRARQGDVAGAQATWEEVKTLFSATPWAKYAGDRLAEVARAGPGG